MVSMCLWVRLGFYLLLCVSFCWIWKIVGWRHLFGDRSPSLNSSHLPGNLTQTFNTQISNKKKIQWINEKFYINCKFIHAPNATLDIEMWWKEKKNFIRFDWTDTTNICEQWKMETMRNEYKGTSQLSWFSLFHYDEYNSSNLNEYEMQCILMVMKWFTKWNKLFQLEMLNIIVNALWLSRTAIFHKTNFRQLNLMRCNSYVSYSFKWPFHLAYTEYMPSIMANNKH